MALSRALKNVVALGVAALLVIGGGSVAFADQIVVDGDGITPVDAGKAASIAACTDKPVQFTVLLTGYRQGGSANQNFANGAEVLVTVGTATPGLSATIADPIITLSNTWQSIPNSPPRTSGEVIAAVVTLQPRSTTGTATINFHYEGDSVSGGTREGDAILTVNVTSTAACILDSTPPALSLPGTITAEATGPTGAVVTYSASATDADPANPTVGCVPASGSTFALGTTNVSCSATDAVGNTASGSFAVVVKDTTAPAVGAMSNVGMEATGATTTVTWTDPTATDAVSGSPAVTCAPASGTAFAVGSTTVTCSATDAAGNTGSSTFSVNISDTTDPSLVLPTEFSVEATGPAGANVDYSASALDAVDGAVAVDCAPASGALLPLGTTTVECSATDSQGNEATGSFLVQVVDTTDPTVNVPADITVEATGPGGADVSFTVTSDDAVSGAGSAVCQPFSGSTFPLGATEVECTALDAAGNEGTGSFTVTVQDTTKPQLTLPPAITAEATGPDGAAVTYSATASDIVSGTLTPVCTPASGSTFALGSDQVDCEVVDGAGNRTEGSFAVFVVDTTGPALTVPGPITAEATGPGGAVVEYEVSASDLVDGPVAASCTPASGSLFPLGTTTVHCSAEDATGNDGSATFDVLVEDTTEPVITVPADIVEEATGPSGAAVDFSVTAEDLVDGAVPVQCAPASGSTFALGPNAVECTAEDAAGNVGHASFGVKVVDTTAPELTVPATAVIEEATGPAGAAVDFTATATDLVDGDVVPDCTPASGSVFALGTHTVACTATDAAGNTSHAEVTVKVVDTTAPDVEVPASITREATGPGGAVVGFTVTATDVVDGALSPSCSPESGALFALGSHTVTCTAADAAGNVGEDAFQVHVVDTTAPAITVPAPISREATGPGTVVDFTATATDVVDGAVTPVCTPASGTAFAVGATTVTCVATDAHGNAGSSSFTVTIVDTTPPAITWVGGPAAGSTHVFGSVPSAPTCTAVDLVVGAVACQITGYSTAVGTHTLTATATDGTNPAGATRSYTVAAWRLAGFHQPVDMGATVWNSVKGGSTVPLKFEVFGGATELVGTSAVLTFTQKQIVCGTSTVIDGIEVTTTGGTTLRYDATGGQFIQNWQTPKSPGACYVVTVTTQDGSKISANFKLK